MSEESATTIEAPDSEGKPLYGWFDGILEGAAGDPVALRAAVDALNGAGPARFSLALDAGRGSILADDVALDGARLRDPEVAERMLVAIREFVRLLDGAEQPESTLRCTLVFSDCVRETLFAVSGHALKTPTRQRAVLDVDREREPSRRTYAGARGPALVRLVGVIALLLLAAGLYGWQSGVIPRLLAARMEAIKLDGGIFGDMLEVRAEKVWGSYHVRVRRGAGYPDGAVEKREPGKSAAARAAARLVEDGGTIYVHVVDAEGSVISSRPIALRALLNGPEAEASVDVPGHMRAASIALALEDVPDRGGG